VFGFRVLERTFLVLVLVVDISAIREMKVRYGQACFLR